MLCGYKGWYKRRPGAIRHVFALHAYSFQYTVLENSPVNPRKSSGNLQLLFRDRIERGRKWSVLPVERKIGKNGKRELVKIPGEVDDGLEVFTQADLVRDRSRFWLIQGDSQRLPLDDHSVDIIATDPPYYDKCAIQQSGRFFSSVADAPAAGRGQVELRRIRQCGCDESDCWHQQFYAGARGNFRGVWARPKEADRADGIYFSPLGSQRVGRAHVGSQKRQV